VTVAWGATVTISSQEESHETAENPAFPQTQYLAAQNSAIILFYFDRADQPQSHPVQKRRRNFLFT
jgi:hypothetical protein